MRAEHRTGSRLGYRNSETEPYVVRKELERRENNVLCEVMVTACQVLILEIGLKIYWNKNKNKI